MGRTYATRNGIFFNGSQFPWAVQFKRVTWGVGFFHDCLLKIRGKDAGLGD